MNTFTTGGLFAGMGGLEWPFAALGFTTRWLVEISLWRQKQLARLYPDAMIRADVRDRRKLPYVDVLTAGFPCQPFTVAGKQLGTEHAQYLIPDMLRVITEVKPRVILFENTPGFATLNDGCEFRGLLCWLAQSGYDAEWCHLRARDFGATHERERLFVVAYTDRKRHVRPDIDRRRSARNEYGQRPTPKQARNYQLYAPVRSRQVPHGRNGTRLVSQSSVGVTAHGLSRDLANPQHPAGQCEQPKDYEAPRLTQWYDGLEEAVETVGNAIVPQVVYPIAQSILEWLQENAAE